MPSHGLHAPCFTKFVVSSPGLHRFCSGATLLCLSSPKGSRLSLLSVGRCCRQKCPGRPSDNAQHDPGREPTAPDSAWARCLEPIQTRFLFWAFSFWAILATLLGVGVFLMSSFSLTPFHKAVDTYFRGQGIGMHAQSRLLGEDTSGRRWRPSGHRSHGFWSLYIENREASAKYSKGSPALS